MSDPVGKPGDNPIVRMQKQLIANIWLNVAAIIFAGIAISFAYFVYFEELEIQQQQLEIQERIARANTYQSNVLTDLEEDLDIMVKVHNATALDTIINNGTHVIYKENGHTVQLPIEIISQVNSGLRNER